ncbi:restriction endonuclease [Mucilaginibacter flavidus]|uniref:restriction endonuclease n=1 Tax=Mucilaginibacter flavidus TaxID=2949309 RepID=UPI002093268D|nr:restriction endonuclease [Mucilaginibacter flavidus]MCO5946621.1 restriction endonuclease [Mucilaginibacter flavidus]
MKKFSPAAITALKEALINIYWKKQDLKNFINLTIKNTTILITIDWESNRKYESVNNLIDRMIERKDIYENDLLELILETANMDDFSHLRQWDDPDLKIKKATEAVANLRQYANGFFKIEQEKKESEIRKRKLEEKASVIQGKVLQIEALKSKFMLLATEPNVQKRGRELEGFLNELFTLFDLEPKRSFALNDEQIDGAFTFENSDYLLEAKWQKRPIETGDLKKFAGTLASKLKNTLGLYVSIDGFTQGARELSGQNAAGMILMDGMDLNAVLEDRIDLHQLLFRKRRHAAETGEIYFSVTKILEGK